MRWLARIAALVACGALAATLGAAWVYRQWNSPLAANGAGVVVDIPHGATLRGAARILAGAGVVGSARVFEWLGRWEGVAGRIRPGEYALNPALTPRQALALLVKGEVVLHPVTIPEGFTVYETVVRLVMAGFGTVPEYHAALNDPAPMRAHGVVTDGVKIPCEGYLFPDTYLFPKGTTPAQAVEAMLTRLDAAFTPERVARMAELGWTRHQVLTLASLIEKETALAAERPRVSAVFHNRLEQGMRLQTDPSVIYAIPAFDGDIRAADLRRDDPYNTYRHHGLPPGPVASPGEASIHAALFPADDAALYFVSRGDGSHAFSRTKAEHKRAVRRYQSR
ncbi:MAG: endolytic transglycosylase MltG [Nitrospirae bacterium]|nr:endolytic transglycosylase MltG [Nitrospirota bacterium]